MWGNTKIERQTTGQMNIEEVLKEWERLKKENEEKRKQETRQWMLQQTGSLFDDFDESSRNGVLEQLQREESLPVEDEKAPANAENQEAPAGERAAVETTAAKAPLVDPSRETETEELEEIEEAPPVADAAQGLHRAECRNRSAGCRAGTALCETGRTGKDRSACNRRNQSTASGSTYSAAGGLRRRKATAGACIPTAGSRACAQHDKGRAQAFCPVHPDQTRNAPAGRSAG